jgi:hypothetical protein
MLMLMLMLVAPLQLHAEFRAPLVRAVSRVRLLLNKP